MFDIKFYKKRLTPRINPVFFNDGGANEDRTRYLFVANESLSQMSYSPIKMVGKTGFEPATPCSQNRCTTKLCYFPTYNGAPSKTRTRNPQIRSLILYPVELWAHTLMDGGS